MGLKGLISYTSSFCNYPTLDAHSCGRCIYFLQNNVHMIKCLLTELRGVYMRKHAPARVSYRDDFLISNRVYMMSESFHISLFEGTLHVDKIHV